MNTLSVTDFRSNLSSSFDRVDTGENVYVRRRNRIYAIIPVADRAVEVTPELQVAIDEARREFREGKCRECKSHEELDALLASL